LEPEHVDQIWRWYRDYDDVPGATRVVTLDEVNANDGNLNITRYVERPIENDTISVEEAVASLKSAIDEAYAAEDRLKELLREVGLLV
jgi:type I restriction enzyme M protein